MNFRISDTFTESLARLTNEEQKAVKLTAYDLQADPSHPGLKFHKLEKIKDKRFNSIYVNKDIRLILHKTEASLLLCYVDHHDKAYQWAERRKLEAHPTTGAAQFVEIREMVREIEIPRYVHVDQPAPPKPLLFAHLSEDDLLGYGVPKEWLADVLAANEDTLLEVAEHLPHEAGEALLQLAMGNKPVAPEPIPAGTDPFAHPDAQRRFRVMSNVEELEQALDYPWEKWTIFLHPAQKQMVERDYNGPARVAGTAGTGKTIVALHRAVYLAKAHPNARVLLTTFSDTLANALMTKLRRLISNTPRMGERLEVASMGEIGRRLFEGNVGKTELATQPYIRALLAEAATTVKDHKFSPHFLMSEWWEVVDAWQLNSWQDYRDVARLGRKTRLPEKQRVVLWSIFEKVRLRLKDSGMITEAEMFTRLAEVISGSKNPPFDFIVVDEAQDVSIPQLRFLAALAGARPNALFLAGDLGQRIFQQPFSWKSLGVDIRGRSKTLKINYRTSHQIRRQADLLLDPQIADVDGNVEERRGAISVFNGPAPEVATYDNAENESVAVGEWLKDKSANGVTPHEMGIFVRSAEQLPRAQAAAEATGLPYKILDERMDTTSGHVSICSMHLAKGLEFRAVAVMACDDEVIPLASRIENVVDDSDLEEVYNTERHLLYVACTRARDFLLVTGTNPASEFLDDLRRNNA